MLWINKLRQSKKLLIICVLLSIIFMLLIYIGGSGTRDYVTQEPTIFSTSSYKTVDKGPRCSEPEKRAPQCIVVGVRKAGTRALLDYLQIHPDVVAAKHEPHFFSSPLYRKGMNYYVNKMPKSCPGQITAEKTPAYFHTARISAPRIQHMNASIKLLVIVREPVSRAVSEYVQFDYLLGRTKPFEHYAFKEAKSSGSRKRQDTSGITDPKRVNERNPRIRLSRYYYLVKTWLRYFRRDQIHFVNGDTLITNPSTEMHKVESFLGLSHFISKDNFFFSEEKGFFCWRKWDGFEKCLKGGKGRPHPKINETDWRILSDYFRPYNKMFFKLIGEDFGWPT